MTAITPASAAIARARPGAPTATDQQEEDHRQARPAAAACPPCRGVEQHHAGQDRCPASSRRCSPSAASPTRRPSPARSVWIARCKKREAEAHHQCRRTDEERRHAHVEDDQQPAEPLRLRRDVRRPPALAEDRMAGEVDALVVAEVSPRPARGCQTRRRDEEEQPATAPRRAGSPACRIRKPARGIRKPRGQPMARRAPAPTPVR